MVSPFDPLVPPLHLAPRLSHPLIIPAHPVYQVARESIYIVANYYPETLAVSVLQDLAWLVKTFVNLVWPFIDSVTKKKLLFETSGDTCLVKNGFLEEEFLLKRCGGALDVSGDLCGSSSRAGHREAGDGGLKA
jgi:hypothetical protein